LLVKGNLLRLGHVQLSCDTGENDSRNSKDSGECNSYRVLDWTVSNFHQVDVVDVITIRGYGASELALKVGLTLRGDVVTFFTELFNFVGVVISIFIYLFA
jgi:hypothetical protein